MIDLRLGDCLDIMRGMEAESIDAVVTDPPYGLSFMGKDWDHGVPGIHFWSEALRVAKPGAYLLAFGGTRTYHRLVCAIEDAGFEIRDTIEWVYGSGFPKSLDVSKAIDKASGAEREIIGEYTWPDGGKRNTAIHQTKRNGIYSDIKTDGSTNDRSISYPATVYAHEWSGWGTALKPAHEPIVVARKPLSKATVAANVLQWGTGALNIDASRIEAGQEYQESGFGPRYGETSMPNMGSHQTRPWVQNAIEQGKPVKDSQPHAQGRFPANLITDGSAEVVAMFPQSDTRPAKDWQNSGDGQKHSDLFSSISKVRAAYPNDTGSAARFFKSCPLDEDDYPPLYYCAKASRRERDAGLEDTPEHIINITEGHGRGEINTSKGDGTGIRENRPRHNIHATVKPLSLMRYLITLCTREGATVLDPFCGSGSTGVACVQLGRDFIGCDNVAEYVEIAKRRIEAAQPVAIELPLMAEA